jgi:hypothetical protein
MQAWVSSKGPAKDARKRKIRAGDSRAHETEESRVQTQNPEPRFLAEARAALSDVRAIWGADAPRKVASTTPEGDQLQRFFGLTGLSDAELEHIACNARAAASVSGS